MTVRGFDPASSTFKYEVNQRFGGIAGTNGALVVPFQVGIQVRMVIGPTGFAAFGGGGPGGGGGGDRGGAGGFRTGDRAVGGAATPGPAGTAGAPGATSPAAGFADRFARFLPDPIAAIQQGGRLLVQRAGRLQGDRVLRAIEAHQDRQIRVSMEIDPGAPAAVLLLIVIG